jgi:hypothetical protein
MEEAQSRSSSSKPKPSARKPVADSKTEEVKEPQLRVADTTVRTRELGVVNQYLEITRLRLAHLLENLRSEESSSLRLRKAIKKLMRVEGSEEFSDTFETLYADYSAVELGEYEWENRYAVHLLGALKALTEIREDFLGFENDTNLDNQVVEQLSPTGEWIACWVYLPGNKGKEPRTNLGRGFFILKVLQSERRPNGSTMAKSVVSLRTTTKRPVIAVIRVCAVILLTSVAKLSPAMSRETIALVAAIALTCQNAACCLGTIPVSKRMHL